MIGTLAPMLRGRGSGLPECWRLCDERGGSPRTLLLESRLFQIGNERVQRLDLYPAPCLRETPCTDLALRRTPEKQRLAASHTTGPICICARRHPYRGWLTRVIHTATQHAQLRVNYERCMLAVSAPLSLPDLCFRSTLPTYHPRLGHAALSFQASVPQARPMQRTHMAQTSMLSYCYIAFGKLILIIYSAGSRPDS